MATFQEMQARMTNAKFKRAVIQHLVEYIDSNFRPIAGGEAKNKLMTDDKVPVPAETFEAIVSSVLLEADGDLEEEMTEILSTNIVVVEEQEVPAKGKKKSTPKEEVKS